MPDIQELNREIYAVINLAVAEFQHDDYSTADIIAGFLVVVAELLIQETTEQDARETAKSFPLTVDIILAMKKGAPCPHCIHYHDDHEPCCLCDAKHPTATQACN